MQGLRDSQGPPDPNLRTTVLSLSSPLYLLVGYISGLFPLQQPLEGLLGLVYPPYNYQVILLNHLSGYIKMPLWLLAAYWTKFKYLLTMVHKAFHSLVPVCLASSSPTYAGFFPHQNFFPEHTALTGLRISAPLLLAGPPLTGLTLWFPGERVYCLVSPGSLSWFPSSALVIPGGIHPLYFLLSQFHVHVSILAFQFITFCYSSLFTHLLVLEVFWHIYFLY